MTTYGTIQKWMACGCWHVAHHQDRTICWKQNTKRTWNLVGRSFITCDLRVSSAKINTWKCNNNSKSTETICSKRDSFHILTSVAHCLRLHTEITTFSNQTPEASSQATLQTLSRKADTVKKTQPWCKLLHWTRVNPVPWEYFAKQKLTSMRTEPNQSRKNLELIGREKSILIEGIATPYNVSSLWSCGFALPCVKNYAKQKLTCIRPNGNWSRKAWSPLPERKKLIKDLYLLTMWAALCSRDFSWVLTNVPIHLARKKLVTEISFHDSVWDSIVTWRRWSVCQF